MSSLIYYGDVRDMLPELEEGSYDACLCDPPYGLSFMGKEWDHGVPGHETWEAVLRVLKPGAPLMAFGGTRTHHRLTCAIEDAGFEIRDCLMWLYGSGFPKSLDISKAIDKAGLSQPDHPQARLDMALEIRRCREVLNITRAELASWFPYKEVTKNWERTDSGFRVPAEFDYQILVERINLDEKWRGMVRAEDKRLKRDNVKTDRRNDETVYGLAHNGCEYESTTPAARLWSGYGTALKPAWEPIILAMKPCEGTFAENALRHGVAGLNIDAGRIPTTDSLGGGEENRACFEKSDGWNRPWMQDADASKAHCERVRENVRRSETLGRWPANLLLDEESAAMLDDQSGITTSVAGVRHNSYKNGNSLHDGVAKDVMVNHADSGGASRFFYCAKASRSERGEGNTHPTVKPLKLCEYLARLILPPERDTPRRLLVPFSGSGSEMIGALRASWDEVEGIENNEAYVEIAHRRLDEIGA
jgi:DNA modification methylase